MLSTFVRPLARRAQILCTLAALIGATLASQAQVQIFMKVGGAPGTLGTTQSLPSLPGESTDPSFPKWVPVHSISFGVSRTGTLGQPGQSAFQDLHLTKTIDRTSPALLLLGAGSSQGLPVGTPIDYVTVDFRRPNPAGGTVVFYRVVMENVLVSNIASSSASGADVGSDSVSFSFERVRWTYVPLDQNGKAGPPVTTGFDLKKNVPY